MCLQDAGKGGKDYGADQGDDLPGIRTKGENSEKERPSVRHLARKNYPDRLGEKRNTAHRDHSDKQMTSAEE